MITPDPRVIFLAIFLVLSIQNLASAAVIRARQGDVSPADGTDGATYTQHPAHQTRPALSDDMRPNSTASRMGMSPGESERPHRGHKNRTSSASWTRPAPSEQTGDVDSGLSKVVSCICASLHRNRF
ncbi:hypothetical protein FA15DRAFT_673981 [Coprinopsis marcescibilis]|uniref:Secreted protein n=1 Tax=Coprinopsis marcescibilis TaxID=230819 RepID=A0A5C3KIG1_COPMA|nr:hypothetical protein FA15DRAFT_673981 [Coprinopsis marcescibilis]